MKRVVVTGATGTIGREVCAALVRQGDTPVALSRDARRARSVLAEGAEAVSWPDPTKAPPPADALAGADAVINLIGAPISQRWSEPAKRQIRESRVASTAMLVAGLGGLADTDRPTVLVSQSATGYYGPSNDRELSESSPAGEGFLAHVVRDWEAAASGAGELMRVAVTRTGVVLSPSGGALAKMLPFFRLGIGGPVAGGQQYVPWIHIDDVVGALRFCVEDARAVGPLNLTAPRSVTNTEFSRALGSALHRPAVLPVPGVALQLLYGEMSEIVTTGQRAVPERLLELGFEFRHPEIEPALREVLAT